MTNAQLFFSIGIPILFNGMLIGVMWSALDRRINRVEDKIDLLTGKVVELMAKMDK